MTLDELEIVPRRTQPGAAYRWREDSPDGRWSLVLTADEVRMSHWIQSGQLYQREPFAHVMAIGDSRWSCEGVRFEDPRTLVVQARRYPGDRPGVTLRLDLEVGRASARVDTGEERIDLSFAELTRWLVTWEEHQASRS